MVTEHFSIHVAPDDGITPSFATAVRCTFRIANTCYENKDPHPIRFDLKQRPSG